MGSRGPALPASLTDEGEPVYHAGRLPLRPLGFGTPLPSGLVGRVDGGGGSTTLVHRLSPCIHNSGPVHGPGVGRRGVGSRRGEECGRGKGSTRLTPDERLGPVQGAGSVRHGHDSTVWVRRVRDRGESSVLPGMDVTRDSDADFSVKSGRHGPEDPEVHLGALYLSHQGLLSYPRSRAGS